MLTGENLSVNIVCTIGGAWIRGGAIVEALGT